MSPSAADERTAGLVGQVAEQRDDGDLVAALVAEVIVQGRRTADWLVGLPLPRLLADDAAVATGAYALVIEFDRLTRVAAAPDPAGGAPDECPPATARPPELAPHAAGHQVRVFVDQFARAVQAHGADRQDAVALRALASQCLALRSRSI